jgi:transposase
MNIKNIDVHTVIAQAKEALDQEKDLSPPFRALIQLLLVIIDVLVGKLGKNSKNSSIPPSQDPNRKKTSAAEHKKKPGGQSGWQASGPV